MPRPRRTRPRICSSPSSSGRSRRQARRMRSTGAARPSPAAPPRRRVLIGRAPRRPRRRILTAFKLNPFEHLNLRFTSSLEDVKRQYRKLSLQVHPDKCKHERAQEAFDALGKAAEMINDDAQRRNLAMSLNYVRELLRKERRKEIKHDTIEKLKGVLDEGTQDAAELAYEESDEFHERWKMKAREVMTDHAWRKRKMNIRMKDEEEKLKKEEADTREMYKKRRNHEKEWEESRDDRMSSWRDFSKGGSKGKKEKVAGELKAPKLKMETSDAPRPKAGQQTGTGLRR
mmetsp:Transcript_22471/g.69745  ORF Transcript_22471/g.69745 Transcript_22471/m.69745 type:complete len:287 (+) Transcript_22471:181-1041(+)